MSWRLFVMTLSQSGELSATSGLADVAAAKDKTVFAWLRLFLDSADDKVGVGYIEKYDCI